MDLHSRVDGIEMQLKRLIALTCLKHREDEASDEVIYLNIGSPLHFERLTLDLGGTRCVTLLSTLLTEEHSYFVDMFSGHYRNYKTRDREYFIDRFVGQISNVLTFVFRDGTHFHHIVNYMRSGHFDLPNDHAIWRDLRLEAQFYGLREASTLLSMESKLLNVRHLPFLRQWCGDRLWQLTKRFSRDGPDTFTKLPQSCLLLALSRNGYLFGCWNGVRYSRIPSESPCIFTLSNPQSLMPTCFRSPTASMRSSTENFEFGSQDLVISVHGECHIGFPSKTFVDVTQRGPLTFTGMDVFRIVEMEVFEEVPHLYT